MQKSTMQTNEQFKAARKWYEIDATGVVLGDLAVAVADILRGKNKPTWVPNYDCGDYVIVRNCEKVVLTGKKMQDKKYYNHSMYIGGLRTRTAQEMINNYADELVYLAVKGMVPGNRLGAAIMKKLFTYKNEGSPHNAQQPEVLKI